MKKVLVTNDDGINAVGLDIDRKDVREASDYFSRYLKFHKLKHEAKSRSETVNGHSVPVSAFSFAVTRDRSVSAGLLSGSKKEGSLLTICSAGSTSEPT